MCKMISFNKVLALSVNNYPSLYHGKTFKEMKLKVMDHLFNVIGNGLNREVFLTSYSSENKYPDNYEEIPEEYYNGTQLFYVYTRLKEYTDENTSRSFKMVDFNSCLNKVLTEKELIGVEYVHKTPLTIHDFHPYPNFQKEYSAIWGCPEIFDIDWLINIKWFYEECLDYFKSDWIYLDFQAIPKDLNDTKWGRKVEEQVRFFNLTFERYRKDEESFEECISREYECEYTGDVKDFMRRRFLLENDRRVSFIEETLEYINTLIKGLDSNEYEL